MSKYEPLATANRRLKEDKNDAEAQKIYDEHFPLYKNYEPWTAKRLKQSHATKQRLVPFMKTLYLTALDLALVGLVQHMGWQQV